MVSGLAAAVPSATLSGMHDVAITKVKVNGELNYDGVETTFRYFEISRAYTL